MLPGHFRARHGSELAHLVGAALAEEAERGRVRVWVRLIREVVDVVITSLRVRLEDGPPVRAASEAEGDGMIGMLRHLRISARTLLRRPGYTLAATLTLGAGVGCAAAAFGVLDALLLQPLPHRRPEQLLMVWRDMSDQGMARAPMSFPTLRAVREQSQYVFSALEAYGGLQATLIEGAAPELVNGAVVTGGMFRMLGNRPIVGRALELADDDAGAEPVVVLSHRLWLRSFGSDAAVLGRMIQVSDRRYRIVGVMGPEFVFPSARAELWVPLRLSGERQQADVNYLVAIARLRDERSIEAAQQRLNAISAGLKQRSTNTSDQSALRAESRHAFIVGEAGRVVWLGAAAAGLLLLIACANLGNLMLVRGLARGRELAVRSALGASRRQVAGELVSEAILVGLAGAILGLTLATVLTRLVIALAHDALPRRLELGVDIRVIAFASFSALACALVCSLVPMLRGVAMARAALATAGGSVHQRGRTLQNGFMIAQVSMALVLLVCAGLLTSALTRLLNVPVGFDGSRVLSAYLSLPRDRFDSDERIGIFYDQLLVRLARLPGVEHVGGTWALPFSPDYAGSVFVPAGAANPAPVTVTSTAVRGDYFAAVGMRLLRGRNFDGRDRADGEAVGIVNETLARRFWPGQDPVGKRMVDPEDPEDALTVIGVVNDVRSRDLAADAEPEVYMPHAQSTWDGNLYVTVKTSGDPLASMDALRSEVSALDRLLPVSRMGTLDALVTRSAATQRFRARIIGALSGVAALLALLGIYAVQSVFVSTCRRDLAVRMALGAEPRRVAAEVTGRGLRLALLGCTIGAGLALGVSQGMETLLFEISPLDARTWLTTVTLFLAAAALACWIPARRIARLDPLMVLRHD